jgi:hypothetical protein
MKIVLRSVLISSFLFSLFIVWPWSSAVAEEVDGGTAASLIMKIAAYDKKLAAADEISVYVIDSEDTQNALSLFVGQKVGKAVVRKVEGGKSVPPYAPGILVIGEDAPKELAVNYAKSLKVHAIALGREALDAGVPVGIVEGDKDARVLLNLQASSAFGLDWNPDIIKVAEIVRAK